MVVDETAFRSRAGGPELRLLLLFRLVLLVEGGFDVWSEIRRSGNSIRIVGVAVCYQNASAHWRRVLLGLAVVSVFVTLVNGRARPRRDDVQASDVQSADGLGILVGPDTAPNRESMLTPAEAGSGFGALNCQLMDCRIGQFASLAGDLGNRRSSLEADSRPATAVA